MGTTRGRSLASASAIAIGALEPIAAALVLCLMALLRNVLCISLAALLLALRVPVGYVAVRYALRALRQQRPAASLADGKPFLMRFPQLQCLLLSSAVNFELLQCLPWRYSPHDGLPTSALMALGAGFSLSHAAALLVLLAWYAAVLVPHRAEPATAAEPILFGAAVAAIALPLASLGVRRSLLLTRPPPPPTPPGVVTPADMSGVWDDKGRKLPTQFGAYDAPMLPLPPVIQAAKAAAKEVSLARQHAARAKLELKQRALTGHTEAERTRAREQRRLPAASPPPPPLSASASVPFALPVIGDDAAVRERVRRASATNAARRDGAYAARVRRAAQSNCSRRALTATRVARARAAKAEAGGGGGGEGSGEAAPSCCSARAIASGSAAMGAMSAFAAAEGHGLAMVGGGGRGGRGGGGAVRAACTPRAAPLDARGGGASERRASAMSEPTSARCSQLVTSRV